MQPSIGVPPPIPQLLRPAPAPVSPDQRVVTLDVLRGFALFGILIVNMALFSVSIYELMMGTPGWSSRTDYIVDGIVRTLAEGKFYPMFAFLFGIGVSIQMERAATRGAQFTPLYCRRLLVLLGFGIVHAFGLWQGDILVLYAVFGFVLIAFSQCRPKTILIWAAVCFILPLILYVGIWALFTLATMIPEVGKEIESYVETVDAEYAELAEKDVEVFAHGSIGEIFVQRAKNVLFQYSYAMMFVPTFFAMFLLGLYAARQRYLQDVGAHAATFRKVLIWGMALGLPMNLVYAIWFASGDAMNLNLFWVCSAACLALGGPVLSLAYVAAMTLVLRGAAWRRMLRPVAAAGRMALSNYLFQSLVCTTIFYSYGLGLFGSLGRTAGIGIAVLIYMVQLQLSVWWLKRFRFGPAEWLWRSLTYGSRQRMRI